MFCKHCGNVMPDDAAFCTKCGTRVSQEARNAVNASARTTPTPSPSPRVSSSPMRQQPARPSVASTKPSSTPMPQATAQTPPTSGMQATPQAAVQNPSLRYAEGILAIALALCFMFVPFMDLSLLGSMSVIGVIQAMMKSGSFMGQANNAMGGYAAGLGFVLLLAVACAGITAVMTLVKGTPKKIPFSWGIAVCALLLIVVIYSLIGQAEAKTSSYGLSISASSMGIGPSAGAWFILIGGIALGVLDVIRGKRP